MAKTPPFNYERKMERHGWRDANLPPDRVVAIPSGLPDEFRQRCEEVFRPACPHFGLISEIDEIDGGKTKSNCFCGLKIFDVFEMGENVRLGKDLVPSAYCANLARRIGNNLISARAHLDQRGDSREQQLERIFAEPAVLPNGEFNPRSFVSAGVGHMKLQLWQASLARKTGREWSFEEALEHVASLHSRLVAEAVGEEGSDFVCEQAPVAEYIDLRRKP